MAIYRGPGGAGDSTDDATISAVAVYASNAAASAEAAATSETNAASSASGASTSAVNAATSESNAATYAANAASNASSAATQVGLATTAATNAATSATAASVSAGVASSAESNALGYRNSAESYAAAAELAAEDADDAATIASEAAADTLALFGSAEDVTNAVTAAATSATNSATSADEAAASAASAASSVTNVANAIDTATINVTNLIIGYVDEAAAYVDEASDYATNAAASADAAELSSIFANLYEDGANSAASFADTRATAAEASATAAEASATAAASSATTAQTSADTAAAITGSGNGTFVNTPITTNSSVTLSGGTTNGVAYLNGSKAITTGSALTFDGSYFTAASGTGTFFNDVFQVSGTATKVNANGVGLEFRGSANPNITAYNRVSSAYLPLTLDTSANIFSISGSEQMRLTSTGLGIGTSSPGAKLDVNGGVNSEMRVTTSGSGYLQVGQFTNGAFIGTSSTDPTAGILRLGTGGTTRATIDSSGNLGLGVTPSAWGSNFRAIELAGGSFWSDNTSSGGNVNLYKNVITANGYTYTYKATANAFGYTQNNSGHSWYTAPSGTAGSAISFTQAMKLDASGNLLVGTTSPSAPTDGFVFLTSAYTGSPRIELAHASGVASGGQYVAFRYNGTVIGSIAQSGTTAVAYNTSSDYRLKNITGPITTSGAYIDSLNPVEGTWKADGSTFVGLIAHEVQEASRTTVATGVKDGEEMQGMDYSSAEIIANLIAEVKALRTRVAALESI